MLQRLTASFGCYLIQFWAPVIIGDRMYLTISDQPFALTELVEGLCSYRKLCLDYLFPVNDISIEGGFLGPPERVFRHGLPEISLNVRHYTTKEYSQRDRAVYFGVRCLFALPVFGPHGCDRAGVLELVTAAGTGFYKYTIDTVMEKLKEVDLRSSEIYHCFDTENSIGSYKALCQIKKALKVVCKTHQLPLAKTWIPSCDASDTEKVMTAANMSYIVYYTYSFADACDLCYIPKGQGVVGKAFSSNGACFCKNLTQLSISEYPLVSSARELGLTGCFAICLRSIHSGDFIYIVEFFLPLKETDCSDPRIFLEALMATMKQQFKSFKVASGQELGEKLFVEVLKTSSTDELDSFEIYHFAGSQPLMELNRVARERNIDSTEHCDIDSSDSGNQRRRKRIDKDYGITIEVLLQHSAKKLEDVANILGVSRSTLKRICRKHNIYRWPPHKAKRHNCGRSAINQEVVQPANERMEDSHLQEFPLRSSPIEDDSVSDAHNKPDEERVQGGSSIIVKITYRDDIIKFILSSSSGKLDLEQQVAKRFNLSVGSFNIKYFDEDHDLVLLTCDADWETCISVLRSLGRNTIKMLVNLLQVD